MKLFEKFEWNNNNNNNDLKHTKKLVIVFR